MTTLKNNPLSKNTGAFKKVTRVLGMRNHKDDLAEERAAYTEIGRIVGILFSTPNVWERFASQVEKVIPFDMIVIISGTLWAQSRTRPILRNENSTPIDNVRENSKKILERLVNAQDAMQYSRRNGGCLFVKAHTTDGTVEIVVADNFSSISLKILKTSLSRCTPQRPMARG